MVSQEYELNSPGAVDPSGLWRFIFWLAFVSGSLILGFFLLMSQVGPPPPSRRGDMRLYYAAWSCLTALMLLSIRMARWIWKIRNPIPVPGRAVRPAMYMVVLIAWVELVLGLVGIIGVAVYRP
jgi:hypothetical protein